MAMEAEWYRKRGHQVQWEIWYHEDLDTYKRWTKADKIITEAEGLPFLELPHPDRYFTNAMSSIYQNNGNFKYLPGTYIMSSNSCWYRKCSFCVERKVEEYQVRDDEDVLQEINECQCLGFREIFDDSGTFPTGDWLEVFCSGLYNLQHLFKIKFSCNMRFGTNPPYSLMKWAGFRMLLYGLESANQETLNKIHKGIIIDDAIRELKTASILGLEPHIAVMFGYPWETDQDAIRTLKLVWWLLKKGYAKTAQASFYCPPDGIVNENHRKYVPMIYNVFRSPRFWLTKLKDIKSVDDIKYYWRALKKIRKL